MEPGVRRSMPIFYLLLSVALVACTIPGIVTSAFQDTYTIAVDERSMSTLASDKGIEWTIEKEILDDKTIGNLNITPYCYSGHVYLVGEYGTLDQVNRASDIASQVKGVESVGLYFIPQGHYPNCGLIDDLVIHMKVKVKLIHDKDIKSTNINVKVVQCHVVLLGIVGSPEEIIQALALSQEVEGVQDVKSFLVSSGRLSD